MLMLSVKMLQIGIWSVNRSELTRIYHLEEAPDSLDLQFPIHLVVMVTVG